MSKTLVERLRAIADDDSYCGVDAGRTSTCSASHWLEDAADRIEELESVLKGKCPKCGEDMESSCYGQSTSCYSCEYVLQGLRGSDE